MKTLASLMCGSLVLFFNTTLAQIESQSSIAEQLGYNADAKLLIIHADDVGVSHSENLATIESMENGMVNSGSIMVPCPWFLEIAEYARDSSETKDFGLHLTITSEWKHYKWGPVLSKNEVPTLINPQGYFYSVTDSIAKFGDPEDVGKEIRAQIKRAYEFGIDVTHLDAHMYAVMSTPEFFKEYLTAGREFNLPILIPKQLVNDKDYNSLFELSEKDVVMDSIYQAYPEVYESGMKQYYTTMLNELEPGLNCLLLHIAYDDREMQGVTIDHPLWGAKWRQTDFEFFTSQECKKLLEENDIKVVSWREIRDKISRKK